MRRTAFVCFLTWLATVAVALAVRPAWPVDETRYLGVAWGMWARGDFLLPRLNGALYSDKPPVLFWLMHAGWSAFGVNAWWPRLIGPLCALLNLVLTARLARRLFAGSDAAALAPLLLCGALLWACWSCFLMFDMLLVTATLLALLGLVTARQEGGTRGLLLFSAALGAGLLIKGPVILLHVLPAALAAPWWSPARTGATASAAHADVAQPGASTSGGRWPLRVTLSVLLGVLLALLWVVPAARAGGPHFRDELLWGQTAQRLAGTAVPHAERWWFYLAVLPVLLLPWAAWPPLWRAALRAWRARASVPPAIAGATHVLHPLRLCVAWAVPALALLSAVTSKQEQYLLPELPALALLGAGLLVADTATADWRLRRADSMPAALLLAAAGAALLLARLQLPPLDIATFADASPLAGIALLGAGAALLAWSPRNVRQAVATLACVSAALLVAAHLGAPSALLAQRDVRPAAARLAELQAAGRPLAFVGKYRAQYDFYGRLLAPVGEVTSSEAAPWLVQHPDGVLIETHATLPAALLHAGVHALGAFPSGESLWESANRGAAPSGGPLSIPDPR